LTVAWTLKEYIFKNNIFSCASPRCLSIGKKINNLNKNFALGDFSKSFTLTKCSLHFVLEESLNQSKAISRKNIPWLMQVGKGLIGWSK